MEKFLAILDLFRKGSAVSDPAAWHNGQITVASLSFLLMAVGRVASAFGHPLPIDQAAADAIAGGLLAVVGVVFPVVTHPDVGLPAKTKPDDLPVADGGGDGAVPDEAPPRVTNL